MASRERRTLRDPSTIATVAELSASIAHQLNQPLMPVLEMLKQPSVGWQPIRTI
jgi:C4-dicarboxylate-specific signal transduction histidine kinase